MHSLPSLVAAFHAADADHPAYVNLTAFTDLDVYMKTVQPRVIIFECAHAGPLSGVPSVQLLEGLDYEFFVLSRHLFRVGVVRVDATPEKQARNEDVVAVLRSEVGSVTALLRGN